MLLESLQQVSDVVLVHDERALEAFPLDDSLGYCRLVGAEVVTEQGLSLGKVRWAGGARRRAAVLRAAALRCARAALPAVPPHRVSKPPAGRVAGCHALL